MSRLSNILTGINPSGGGVDESGNPIQSLIPGGGVLSGIAQAIGGFADARQAKKDLARARNQKRKAQERRQKARAGLDAFEFDVSQAQRDLATAGIRPTDLSPMQGIQATELAALSTDPRALLGGLGASTARAQQATMAAQQADLGRELAAMRNLANLEQSALEKKQNLQFNLLEGDRQLALADRAQARQNIADARQARREGIAAGIGGLANIGIAAATGGLGPTIPSGGAEEKKDNLTAEEREKILNQYDVEKGGRVKYGHGGKMNEDVIIAILEEGGMNAPVTKLEGEFDHSTNKKAIVDEETGVKEAEATGGEYILNPEQGEEISMAYKGIEQIVDSGEEPTMDQLMALYEAVRSVFSQPQFNEA